ATSSTAPNRNRISAPGSRGAAVMLSTSTMAVMGSTEDRDSLTFSRKALMAFLLRIRVQGQKSPCRRHGQIVLPIINQYPSCTLNTNVSNIHHTHQSTQK